MDTKSTVKLRVVMNMSYHGYRDGEVIMGEPLTNEAGRVLVYRGSRSAEDGSVWFVHPSEVEVIE